MAEQQSVRFPTGQKYSGRHNQSHWGLEWSKRQATIAKAFDLVDHKILLEKLSNQLPEWVVSWIAAYLTGRQQRVKLGTTTTELKPVEAEVIQGGVLGPILFLLFIADINESIPAGVELLKYADDIPVYISRSKHDDQTMQAATDGISNWCKINKMQLNSKKC